MKYALGMKKEKCLERKRKRAKREKERGIMINIQRRGKTQRGVTGICICFWISEPKGNCHMTYYFLIIVNARTSVR